MSNELVAERFPVSEVERYRCLVTASDLVAARVRIRESDLLVRADRDLSSPARAALVRCREELEGYLYRHPEWGRSLVPVSAGENPPAIIAAMSRAAAACGVGPMATVAGALAWFVGRDLSPRAGEVIVENGGDIYLDCRRERIVLVRPGPGSDWPGRVALRVPGHPGPVGVAASSGREGRSLSWGKASAAAVTAEDSILADGAATALGNRIRSAEREPIEAALGEVLAIPGVFGCLVILPDLLAVRGEIELADPAGEADGPPGPR